VEFIDGSTESVFIPNFRGTPGNPMSDAELSSVFRLSAAETLTPAQADAVLDSAWGLMSAPDIRPFMALLAGG
jgi:glucuronate isomerase